MILCFLSVEMFAFKYTIIEKVKFLQVILSICTILIRLQILRTSLSVNVSRKAGCVDPVETIIISLVFKMQ